MQNFLVVLIFLVCGCASFVDIAKGKGQRVIKNQEYLLSPNGENTLLVNNTVYYMSKKDGAVTVKDADGNLLKLVDTSDDRIFLIDKNGTVIKIFEKNERKMLGR